MCIYVVVTWYDSVSYSLCVESKRILAADDAGRLMEGSGREVGYVGERGSASKRGRHTAIFVLTQCICAVAALMVGQSTPRGGS